MGADEVETAADAKETVLEFILLKFDELVALVSAMDDERANAELPVDGSNSTVQLLVHCCGMLRRWSSSVNLGVEVPRDREAEFTAVMPVAQALELAARTRAAFVEDIQQTDLAAAPAAVPAGRETFWTATCHGVLLHVLEELAQHLGHAEIARDVLAAGGRDRSE